jgi:RNA polymerase sigma factor (sigma-70 family)
MKGEIREMTCTEVYEQYEKFIIKIAFGFVSSGQSIDDLVQLGNVALVKAFNTYKYERNIMFITYLATIVKNELKMSLRRIKPYTASLDDIITNDNGDTITLLNLVRDPVDYEELVINNITFKELQSYIYKLKPRFRAAFLYFYFYNFTQKEISIILNCHQSYVSRILKQSSLILKNKLGR